MNGGAGEGTVRSYTVAGLRVRSARPLPGLDEDGWSDGEVVVEFGDPTAAAAAGWHVLPARCGCEGAVAGDGSSLILRESADPAACGATVRQAVPFAAILQGKVTLHAAAVACPDGVAAFTGASGAGKSTLAAALARAGVPVCADDLLPCRVSDGRVVAPVPGTDDPWHLAPVVRVYFLRSRGAEAAGVGCDRLPSRDAVLELVRNGFGELGLGDVWRVQLDLYVALAEQAGSFALRLPDGLDRMPAAAAELAALLRAPDAAEAPG